MRSQFIDRRTQPERAVPVEICDRGGAGITDVGAIEGVCGSGPCHEHRRRQRPSLLDVLEQAILIAHDEVQIACASHNIVQSQHINQRTLSERAITVESECRGTVITDVDVFEGVRA